MLDSGTFATIAGLAAREKITLSYLTCVLRLTQLAPDLVEAILEARQPRCLTLEALRQPLPETGSSKSACLVQPSPARICR